jgi:hypothetical protein
MKKIIGICGLKNSGKDTIGDIICKNDDSFVKMSFADTLKDITAILMGWDRELLQGSTIESRECREKADDYWSDKFGKMITPRIILQELGTNVLRNQFLQSIWVDSLQKKLMEMEKNVVITDVRFPNEIDAIKELGGTIYRVERGELPKWYYTVNNLRLAAMPDANIPYIVEGLDKIHESEWKWIGYDRPEHIFKNDGSIEDLEKEVLEKMGE